MHTGPPRGEDLPWALPRSVGLNTPSVFKSVSGKIFKTVTPGSPATTVLAPLTQAFIKARGSGELATRPAVALVTHSHQESKATINS